MLKLSWEFRESYQNSIISDCQTRKALQRKGFPNFLLIPIRSPKLNLKRICLGNLAVGILIICIIGEA